MLAGGRRRIDAARRHSRWPMIRLWKAFLNTLNGLGWALRHEQAIREEFAALAVGLPASFFVAPSLAWWLAVVGSLLMVIVTKLLNTAVEQLSDHVTPEHSHAIKVVKHLGSDRKSTR